MKLGPDYLELKSQHLQSLHLPPSEYDDVNKQCHTPMHLKYSLSIASEWPKDVKLIVHCLQELRSNRATSGLGFVHYIISMWNTTKYDTFQEITMELLFSSFLQYITQLETIQTLCNGGHGYKN